MKIEIPDFNKLIQEHNIKEVTSPIYFVGGTIPDENGLFSTEIFGRPGSKERKTTFAYIDLHGKFVHPVFFKLFCSMNKKMENVLLSKDYYRIENGDFVQDDNGETGPSFFYRVYDQLRFINTGTMRRDTYITLLEKSSKEEIFCDKWLVIPPYLRDYNPNITDPNEIKAVDTVNDMYVKLIRYSMSIAQNKSGFMNSIAEANLQQMLYNIYEYFIFKLNKKTGMLHQSLLGKNIDYATRSVITAPRLSGSGSVDKVQVKFGYIGIPLSQVVVLFYPFFINYIQNYIEEHEMELSKFKYKGKDVIVSNVREQFNEEAIKKLMNLYIKSVESRFKPLTIKGDDGEEYPIDLYKKDLGRLFTMTDLFYIAAYDIIGQEENSMHVYATRYPIEQYQNIFPARVAIMTTKKTKKQKIANRYLPDYPIIYDDYMCDESIFIDSIRMHNSYLDAIGGDYDG